MQYLPLPLEPHIDVEEFDPAIFDNMPIVRRRKRKSRSSKPKPDYLDCVCAFDIEATNIHEIKQAVMYIWQFQIEDKLTVFGRTWESFFQMLRDIDRRMKDNVKLCIYIHNLSYEFVFFESWYPFQIDEVFALQRRKVARCDMYNHIEFRCSYIHSNMSLREYTRKMNVKHKKLDDYDYDLPLYPWSSLTVEQLRYCQNDVLGLCEAIRKEMEQEHDTLITIPLTSTGYVRRDCKKAMHSINYHYAQPFFRPSPCTA